MSVRGRKKTIKAGRRGNENKFNKLESLTLQDVQCTVCMGIFVEPVTLPCYHTTCKVCFEKTIDNNTLACPLCRKYVGTWVRQHKKSGLMVNQALWSYVRQRFDSHVQKKLKGEDDEEIDGLAELNIQAPKICEPGVIRKEYEAEQRRIQEEAEKRQQMEAQASEKLIKELQEREEEERRHLEELRKKAEEEDALIAQRIAAQLQAEDARREAEEEENVRRMIEEEGASSAFVRLPSNLSFGTPSQPVKKGPMDIFLSQNNLGKPTRTGSSSSTDSLSTEMQHFRPVHYVPTTPPKNPSGKSGNRSQVHRPVPVMQSLNAMSPPSTAGPSSSTLRPWLKKYTNVNANDDTTNCIQLGADKRERSPSDFTDMPSKKARRESPRKTHKPQPKILGRQSSNSSGKPKPSNGLIHFRNSLVPLSLDALSESAECEKKYRQEKEDYEFALQLQRELNAMESQSRSYELRSVVSLSPRKSQPKLVTPRRKSKPKPPTSSGKKEKRRQCTLEESMGFSVKMEL